ncbi:MAG: proteasome subunit alpha [Candidatus Latescibacterota bacterium]|nr:proteasome subunit alpha [Candidatus Latescibacterota bacterium]
MESADFLNILREQGHLPEPPAHIEVDPSQLETTEGTTILALRYRDGVLVAGDRRATAGNVVVYDRADKVLSVDDRSVLALSGSPANAYEIARLLEISFQHYRRTQLQELSLDGRLRTLSRLLRDNLPMAMQGIGAVVPIYCTYEAGDDGGGKIYFYDVLGAQFESVDFCTTGSGSPIVRGALYYQNRWEQPLAERDETHALELVVKMLETASEYDTATGGYRPVASIFPQVMRVNADGITSVDESELAGVYNSRLGGA